MTAPSPRAVPMLGVSFDPLTEPQVVQRVVDEALLGRGGWVCPVNVDVLRQTASPEIRELVNSADLVVADGQPLIWASRLAGQRLPARVAGSSLIHTVASHAATRGCRLFLLGGNEGAADTAAARLAADRPGLEISGTLCPPFGFEHDAGELRRIDDAVRATGPHVVFVGLGFPKQDRLISQLRRTFPELWFVSCGISFSFAAGEIERAPVWLQRLGLEWLHRLVQEPGRLYRRYLIDGPPFLLRLFGAALRARISG